MDDKTYEKYWNLWCRQYDPENLELKYLREIADIKDKKILEIGCGNGRFTRILAKYAKSVVGIDYDKKMIESAKNLTKKKNISYKLMDALDLKFKNESFDIVIFTWTLVVIHKKETIALKEAKRVLKKGGILALIEPGGKSDYAEIVKPYVSNKSSPIKISESYEEPLKKVFKNGFKKIGPIGVPYVFDNQKQAFDVFKFAIEGWHKSVVPDPLKLKKQLSRYKKISESVYFYGVSK